MNKLLLASKSESRKQLLDQAKIPYQIIEQNALEDLAAYSCNAKELAKKLAILKMEHAILPKNAKDGDNCFVLTADTIGVDNTGKIYGKPKSLEEAVRQLKQLAKGKVITSFCLDKKKYYNNKWHINNRICKTVQTSYIFEIPDNLIQKYFDNFIGSALDCAGSIDIENYGAQFLKKINGSYTNIIGLPIFELRQALNKLNFF